MILYLVKGYLDVAATSLADAQALYTALLDQSDADNAATIDRVTAKLETLVQSDTGEPLVISSIDDAAGTISSWVTDATITLAVGLGEPDPNNNRLYAYLDTFTIGATSRTGTLALNTAALAAAVSRGHTLDRRFQLQIVITRSTGRETLGLLSVLCKPAVFTTTPAALTAPSYLTAAEIAAQFQAIQASHIWAPLYYFGAATDEQSFGYFETPVALEILGMQIAAQNAPTGSALTVDLVDSNGVELALIGTLAAAATYQETTFGTAYSLAAGSFIRAKIKSVGSTLPGGYLTVTLLCRITDTADNGYAFPVSVFFGTATDEQAFGYWRARVASEIVGCTLTAQVAPTGAAITVDLLDSSGAELGQVATLAAGATYQATDYAVVTTLAASDFVRFRIKSVGSTAKGAYLTATLITRPV